MNNLDEIDSRIAAWMRKYGIIFLRYSLGAVFIWFGALKIVGHSPATQLVARAVYWVDPSWFVPLLGYWELLIGVLFLFRPMVRVAILLLAPQMAGTFLPLIVLPSVVFQMGNPLLLTLEGQYIVKNLLLISAALVIGAHVREKEGY